MVKTNKMTKIIIEGDLNKDHIKKIAKLMVKMFKGKKEHANMSISGIEEMSLKETKEMLEEIWNNGKETMD